MVFVIVQVYADGLDVETDLLEQSVIHNQTAIEKPGWFAHHIIKTLVIQTLNIQEVHSDKYPTIRMGKGEHPLMPKEPQISISNLLQNKTFEVKAHLRKKTVALAGLCVLKLVHEKRR